MRKIFSVFIFMMSLSFSFSKAEASPNAKSLSYFELKVYHISTSSQEATIDSFLRYQYLPFLHAAKINHVGVFKPISNDTASDKKIYVFIPFKSLKEWESLSAESFMGSQSEGYAEAPYTKPAYNRIETILLKAFPMMPELASSKLTAPKSERVYELRSYESPSEKYFKSKVKMFNEGGEIGLFARLGFNGVFYSEVVFGSKMPNLMYMTSFENMKTRDEHWKTFSTDPEWKVLSAKPEYQNNVAHIDIVFLRSAEFSDL